MKRKSLSDTDLKAAQRLKEIWMDKKPQLGLTQERAAEMLGFSTQGAVSHYINGQTPLNLEAVLKFAGLLKVPPESIRPDMADLLHIARIYSQEQQQDNVVTLSADTNQKEEIPSFDVDPIERDLIQTFRAFPKEDQEQMLKEMKEKKETMDRTVARWLAAQKGRRA
ncbi:TPA: helix-turn-helix domain-containing protein [Escherichia coli]|nr:helix-turn-helix domain-containing protein [Escherichia coli]HEL8044709.1 helix-turn-helix domain-containing protein [Escherichia coli]HEL8049505.1 helix-turn-helix domain-containing protein [Escherichia coli]HEL8054295.1 helix-turn-helix domain-containing protein [Escherichia coli]HEL8059119.1 helix-turn-helix domain-containing protein [Escherichia coli]